MAILCYFYLKEKLNECFKSSTSNFLNVLD